MNVTNWRAVTEPHDYNDGTTHRWRVIGDGLGDPAIEVELADWLTEDSARLIAAAPALLEAAEAIVEAIDAGLRPKASDLGTLKLRRAIAQAKGE